MSAVTGHRVIVVPPHDLECAEPAGELLLKTSQQRDDTVEVGQSDDRILPGGGLREQSDDGTRYDTEGPFGSDKELLDVVPGIVFQHPVQ